MKLKTLAAAALIASSLAFSLPAYSSYCPEDINTYWLSMSRLTPSDNTSNYAISNVENIDAPQFSMLGNAIWSYLKAQEKIEMDVMQLNIATKELRQALTYQKELAYSTWKAYRDSKKYLSAKAHK